jgi:hypothetical protein
MIIPAAHQDIYTSLNLLLRTGIQFCGSGIRDLVPFNPWIRGPGWVKNQDPVRDEQPGSYFRELVTIF